MLGRMKQLITRRRAPKQQPTRIITVPAHHDLKERFQHPCAGNKTRTTKYNLLSFFPKALFEQYR